MLTGSSSRRTDRTDVVIAIAVAALGAAALAMPDTVLHLSPPCLISLLLDDVCWGCGITRATLAFVHGNFAVAWAYNKASVVVVPMLIILYIQHLRMLWRRKPGQR